MGFKIVKQPRAWWPVKWDGVAEDGSIVVNEIEMRFAIMKVDAAAAFIRDVVGAQAQEQDEAVNLPVMYAGLAARIASDWRGVQAENGDPLPWTDENLTLLMNEGGMFRRVFGAWRDCLAGQREHREGN